MSEIKISSLMVINTTPCPFCRSKIGSYCVTASGDKYYKLHTQRINLAIEILVAKNKQKKITNDDDYVDFNLLTIKDIKCGKSNPYDIIKSIILNHKEYDKIKLKIMQNKSDDQ